MPNAAVVTVSDRCFQGLRPDEGGPLVAEMLTDAGYTVTETVLVPDEQPQIEAALIRRALVRADLVQVKAAELLGISKSLLQYKLKKYAITGH